MACPAWAGSTGPRPRVRRRHGVPTVHFSQDTPPPEPPAPVAPSILTVGGEFHTVTVASAAVDGKEDTVPPAAPSPIMRRRRLGIELRRLREAAGLTGDQVIERIGWASASKLSRLENGRSRPDPQDVARAARPLRRRRGAARRAARHRRRGRRHARLAEELPGDDPAAAQLGPSWRRAARRSPSTTRCWCRACCRPPGTPGSGSSRPAQVAASAGEPGARRRAGDRGAGAAGPPVAADPGAARAALHGRAGGGRARPPGRAAGGAARATASSCASWRCCRT